MIKYLDENGLWSYEIELNTKWKELGFERQELVLKYLKLLKRFQKDPSKIGHVNKKLILVHCECETWLVPKEEMKRFDLTEKNDDHLEIIVL